MQGSDEPGPNLDTCLALRVLPYCSDEQLLRELTVVVSAGWGLPSREQRAADVRHLLLLADTGQAAPYRQRAQRLLVMIDQALRQAAGEERLTEDDEHGLRILLGTHPTYRSEPSPTVRREEASVYLVQGWADDPPSDRAGTFQRRHQEPALRQVLTALREAYGQEQGATKRDHELLSLHRWYVVDERRQVCRMGGERVVRSRQDGLDIFEFDEARQTDPGVESSTFDVSEHPVGPSAQLAAIKTIPYMPTHVTVTLRLSEPVHAGQLLGFAWQEEIFFGADVNSWPQYFVATQGVNDDYELDMSVVFEGELPGQVWWFEANPQADMRGIEPRPHWRLQPDSTGLVRHRWQQTERRINYGLKWRWLE